MIFCRGIRVPNVVEQNIREDGIQSTYKDRVIILEWSIDVRIVRAPNLFPMLSLHYIARIDPNLGFLLFEKEFILRYNKSSSYSARVIIMWRSFTIW